MKMTTSDKWISDPPKNCNFCKVSLHNKFFIDGRTKEGPWAIMCSTCHVVKGCGFGIGKGQRYCSKTLKKVEG